MARHQYLLKRKRNTLRTVLLVWAVLMLLILGIYGLRFYNIYNSQKVQTNQNIDTSDFYKPSVPPVNSAVETPTSSAILPDNALVDIAFTSQAPLTVWDALHEDACEEASFLMVKHYLDKTPLGSPNDVDQEIQNMVAWETANNYGPSITVEQLNIVTKAIFGMTGQVKTATKTNIEADIASGHPVIIPAAGKLLGNPNFRSGGPAYHMLVVKGYDSANFITNDPGTRKGNGYIYDQTVLMTAIHNWDPTDILNGPAKYIVY